ncbi:helix-turn-helix domain-containing protein [Thauera humireducens]|uniref:HTH cro/C1-type domain-containing protein n=1 Tax=Thauera humireducens TaxID=1134435 RepID=A0A127K3U6_9RHOO|nr:hypothetical protein AC731_006570 [Thauera humireducens]
MTSKAITLDPKARILDLCQAGMTQTEIGQAIGLSQPAVSDLVRGRTTTVQWEVGQALIALHAKHVRCSSSRSSPEAA